MGEDKNEAGQPVPLWQSYLEILACPTCQGSLRLEPSDGLRCESCAAAYPVLHGKVYFCSVPKTKDALDDIKSRLKAKLGQWYYTWGIWLLAPTYPFNFAKFLASFPSQNFRHIVDIGSGNHRIAPGILAVDCFDYPAVDVVCDIHALPFRTGTVDMFISRSVLEHLRNPFQVASETSRCTRMGGLGVHSVPFLFPFHASPDDFFRFTHHGLPALFPGWELKTQFNITGPVTLALLFVIELVTALVGAIAKPLKPYVYLMLCLVLFPFKFLDAPFVRRKAMLNLAPTILSVMEKPDDSVLP